MDMTSHPILVVGRHESRGKEKNRKENMLSTMSFVMEVLPQKVLRSKFHSSRVLVLRNQFRKATNFTV
jgi:hypothetical protein